jgi:hypothetical protein
MVPGACQATGPDRGGPGGLGSTRELASRHENASVNLSVCPECGLPAEARPIAFGCASSAADSGIGYSRLPGTLGTVANADSGAQNF